MKHLLYLLCTLLLIAIISPTYAYDFQSGDLYYNITSNTTVEVASHYDHEDLVTAIIPKNVIYNNINYKVTNIGDQAFDNCSSLTSITIPNSVTSIGYAAFKNCYSLTSVTIPNSVTSIGRQAFYGCSSLNETNYVGNIAEWCNIDFATTDANPICCSHNLYINDQEIKDLVIPNTVDSIQDYAFYECFSLKSVTIPNSVKSIGYHTFYRCCFLKKDFVNNSPLDAEENGYWGAGVGEIEVDGMIIQGTTVVGCRKNVTIATIPNYITRIGSNAFAKCSSLTLVTISSRINSIGSGAFDGCDALTKTNYLGDIAGWCAIKFGGSSANPISNSHNLYINNQEIRDLVIPNTVDSIHNYAFYECFSLTSVSIGNSVTSIGDYAFYVCSSLTSVTIGNSVKSIGRNAFSNCSSLTSINIPESVTNIWYGAFDNTGIYNDESNWENNVLYIDNCLIALKCNIEGEYTIKDGVRLIAGGTFWDQNNMTKVNFPNSVKSISAMAFSSINMTSLEIPNSVKNIEERAFRGCRYLSSVTLGNDLTHIKVGVFEYCSALTSITIPNSVTHIGASSFGFCSSLTTVTIGNNVTSIGDKAFTRCDRLSDIYCYGELPPSSQESSFPHYYTYVYVPCESIQHYQSDDVWGRFQNIECIGAESENITTDDVIVSPSTDNVTITWPTEDNADTYSIVIEKDNEVFCTLTFNADGLLLNIAFAPARNGSHHAAQYAAQTAKGMRFTVTGLEEATTYAYNITAKDASDKTIKSHSGEFTTQSTTAVEEVEVSDNANVQKTIHDGQLLILRDGKTYNAMGQEM